MTTRQRLEAEGIQTAVDLILGQREATPTAWNGNDRRNDNEKDSKRRWNPTCYCVRDVAMILFPIINTEQTHEEHPHARRMARPF
ncbi:hypothetical protein ACMV5I_28970, partial [Serratia sp. T13T92]|uniref:hypothetical protein n=1 Tax=Serratia sp. T13T92 TaxID=3397496 RepID=UPI0039E1DF6F